MSYILKLNSLWENGISHEKIHIPFPLFQTRICDTYFCSTVAFSAQKFNQYEKNVLGGKRYGLTSYSSIHSQVLETDISKNTHDIL